MNQWQRARWGPNPWRQGMNPYYRGAAAVAGLASAYGAYRTNNPVKRRRQIKRPGQSKYKKKSELKKINSKLKYLKHKTDALVTKLTHRELRSTQLAVADNLQASVFKFNDVGSLESVLDNLEFYDSSTNTFVMKDPASQAEQNDIFFNHSSMTMDFTNNYITRAHLKVYLCKPRRDTSLQPDTCWTNGASDQGGDATNPLSLPSDYQLVTDLWKLKKVKDVVLDAGQRCSVSHIEKDFAYDSSLYDSHNLSFQKSFKSFGFLCIVSGTTSHSAGDGTVVGYAQTALDYTFKRSFKVSYNGGLAAERQYVNNVLQTMTSPVQGKRSIADNQAYSVA